MKLPVVSILLLLALLPALVISASTSKDAMEPKEPMREARSNEQISKFGKVTNESNRMHTIELWHDTKKEHAPQTESEPKQAEDVSVEETLMETPMEQTEEAASESENEENSSSGADEPKVFTLSNHQLADLHWELFGDKTQTTQQPPHYPNYYPTRPPTRRPTYSPIPGGSYPNPYPPYPYPPGLRPPYPPYLGPPGPPFGIPPYGVPPYSWWWIQRPIQPIPPTTITTPAPSGGSSSGGSSSGGSSSSGSSSSSSWSTGSSSWINVRPSRRRRPTRGPNYDNTYQDYIQSLRPAPGGQPQPIYLTAAPGQTYSVPQNVYYNPAVQQLVPVSPPSPKQPLYVQTSVQTLPSSNVLSLSTSLSSAGHHQVVPVTQTQNVAPQVVATAPQTPSYEMPIQSQTVNKRPIVPGSTVTTNQNFCEVFSWICESNSKVKVAQFENPNSPTSQYVVMLVQPPTPTQISYMRSDQQARSTKKVNHEVPK